MMAHAQPQQELYGPLGGLWDEMLRNEVQVWARFNSHWLARGLPLLAVRYEDLLLHPEEMLVRLVAFLEQLPLDAVRASPAHMARVRAAATAVGSRGLKGGSVQPPPPPPAAATATTAAAIAAPVAQGDEGAPLAAGAAPASGRVSDPLHANRPRGGGKIGASLRHYSAEQVRACVHACMCVCVRVDESMLRMLRSPPLSRSPSVSLATTPSHRSRPCATWGATRCGPLATTP